PAPQPGDLRRGRGRGPAGDARLLHQAAQPAGPGRFHRRPRLRSVRRRASAAAALGHGRVGYPPGGEADGPAGLTYKTPVTRLTFDNAYAVLHLDGGEGGEPLEGRGVYYAATPTEAQLCRGSDVVVVVVGNSAGQAAVYL